MDVWPFIGMGVVGLIGAATAFYFRWRAESARREADAQRRRAVSAEDSLAVEKETHADEHRREEAVIRVLRTDLEAHRRQVAHLVRGNPELAREYLRGVLDEASGDPTKLPPDRDPTGKGSKGGAGGSGN